MANMPDVTGVLVACVAAMFATHCWVFSKDFKSFLSFLDRFRSQDDEVEKSRERMEAAFWEASIKQYQLASAAWAHLAAVVVPGIALHWLWTGNSAMDPFHIFTIMGAWGFHSLITTGAFPLTRTSMRLLAMVNFFLTAGMMQKNHSDDQIVAITALQTATRFANVACFVDFKTNLITQSLVMILEIRAAWLQDPNAIYESMLLQGGVTTIVLFVSGLLEISIRSQNALLLDSEAMVSSFRQMLRGVCDGEVLLDSELKISGKADCLLVVS